MLRYATLVRAGQGSVRRKAGLSFVDAFDTEPRACLNSNGEPQTPNPSASLKFRARSMFRVGGYHLSSRKTCSCTNYFCSGGYAASRCENVFVHEPLFSR